MSQRSDLEEIKKDRLIEIIEKDFEELTVGERQTLRHRASEKYGNTGKLTDEQLLFVYLKFKLMYITPLELLTFTPHPLQCDFGPFGGIRHRYPIVTVTTFGGLNLNKTGTFTVKESMSLPLFTVFYETEYIEAMCLAPDGYFCRISNREFLFDV